MKIFVTGGAGFIGSHLVDRLVKEGHHVTVLDILKNGNKLPKKIIKDVNLVIGDVRDEDTVMKSAKGSEVIFHLAAVLGVDVVAESPVETMDTEYFGLKNAVKASLYNSVGKLIYASTSGVYGKAALVSALEEEFPVSPNSSYSIAKRFCELYLKSIYQEKKLDSFSLRFFNVYGPRQDNRMVIPRFLEQAEKNLPMTVFKPGTQTRDYTYIDGVVKSLVLVMKKLKGNDIMNVSNQKEFTVSQLAKEIKRLTDSKSEIKYLESPPGRNDYETERRFGSSKKLKKLIGYAPDTSLNDGLTKTIDYINNNK